MVAVVLHQRDEKLLRRGVYFGVVEAESGESAGGAAAADAAVDYRAVARQVAGVRIFVEHPLRRGGDEFRDHDFDAVLRGQIHHAVIIAPVVFARRDFDGGPHEPMAERVHANARRGLMIARPILFRRIRFAEIDGSVGKHRLGSLGRSKVKRPASGPR